MIGRYILIIHDMLQFQSQHASKPPKNTTEIKTGNIAQTVLQTQQPLANNTDPFSVEEFLMLLHDN